MIIQSNLNNSKYFWVKVPRTATTSYFRWGFLKKILENNAPNLVNTIDDRTVFWENLHLSYIDRKNVCNNNDIDFENINGFSVVRNPYTRFISILENLFDHSVIGQHNIEMLKQQSRELYHYSICGGCYNINLMDVIVPSNSTQSIIYGRGSFFNFIKEDIFYDFIYSNFNKNCEKKYNCSNDDIFSIKDTSYLDSMFKTQMHWAYHPKVKIFKYENLSEFNNWLNTTLGYDFKNIPKINSNSHVKLPIDTTTKKFKQLVQYLFYDDFKAFGYAL